MQKFVYAKPILLGSAWEPDHFYYRDVKSKRKNLTDFTTEHLVQCEQLMRILIVSKSRDSESDMVSFFCNKICVDMKAEGV
jgi:hypothetical protein